MQTEKIDKALSAVEALCGKCPVCSPECSVAVARRALQGLRYDMKVAEEAELGKK